MYFDSDNNIRKYLSDGLTGVHCTVSHIIILMGDWYMGYILERWNHESCMPTPGFHIEHFPEENECNDCFEATYSYLRNYMEAQYNR